MLLDSGEACLIFDTVAFEGELPNSPFIPTNLDFPLIFPSRCRRMHPPVAGEALEGKQIKLQEEKQVKYYRDHHST